MENIKSVELREVMTTGGEKTGERQFVLRYKNQDDELFVPNDPSNRHYLDIKAWHKAQKKAPFPWPKPDKV